MKPLPLRAWPGIFVALALSSAAVTVACSPKKDLVADYSAIVAADTSQVKATPQAEAPYSFVGDYLDVEVYKDPSGCQYLVFYRSYTGDFQVVPRQHPRTNGMCVASDD